MLSFDITIRRQLSITANSRPARQRISFCAGAGADCNHGIACGMHVGAILELKACRRDSIAAQKTFQIVHFLAGTGGLAEPAAEFL